MACGPGLSRASRSPNAPAGRRRGDLVAAERRGRGGRDDPNQHGAGRHSPRPHAAADAACDTLAADECLSPGLELDPGGIARSGPAAPGPLRARTLAYGPGAGGGDPSPAGAGTAPGRLRPQAAGATGAWRRIKT